VGGTGLTVSAVSIDLAAARDAAWYAQHVVVGQLCDARDAIERAARGAHIVGDVVPLVALEQSIDAAVAAAALLSSTADAAEQADAEGAALAHQVVDFLVGDLLALWNGGRGGFPFGQVVAGGLRIGRVWPWLSPSMSGPVPVFSNGAVGRLLASGLSRIPHTAAVGAWLPTDAATGVFRRLGIVGAGVSTAVGVYDLWQQGHPGDAFERDGAGYVADVAGTAFSASTVAFLVAPSPVTAAFVVGTGLVWIGAEVWDAWGDEISTWVDDRLDEIADVAAATWDVGADAIDRAHTFATDTLDVAGAAWDAGWDTASNTAGAVWDAGSGFVADVGGALGGLFD
jgi:hypothetical protein